MVQSHPDNKLLNGGLTRPAKSCEAGPRGGTDEGWSKGCIGARPHTGKRGGSVVSKGAIIDPVISG